MSVELPDLSSFDGIDRLRDKGYQFSFGASPYGLKQNKEVLDLAVKTLGIFTKEEQIVADIAYLLLDSILAKPPGFEFFPHFPKEEVAQFCNLSVSSRLSGQPLTVVAPVCPDLTHGVGYELGEGVDDSGELVLANLNTLLQFFANRNQEIQVQIYVADVEAYNAAIADFSKETPESFLAKTGKTITRMRDLVQPFGGVVTVGSMLSFFNEVGLDYFDQKAANVRNIQFRAGERKIKKVLEALVKERVKRSTAQGKISEEDYYAIAIEELADYATFGEAVTGRAVILSSDAKSAVPAYNILRAGQNGMLVNPTIYLKAIRNKNFSVFME